MYFTIELDPTFKFCGNDGTEIEAIPVPDIIKQEYIPPTITYVATILNPYTIAEDSNPVLVCDNNRDYILEVVFTRTGSIEEDYSFDNFYCSNGYVVYMKDIVRIREDVYHIIFNVFPNIFGDTNVLSSMSFRVGTPLGGSWYEFCYYYYTASPSFVFSIMGPSTLAAGASGTYTLETNLVQNDLGVDNIKWFVWGDATIVAGSDPYHAIVTANTSGTVNPLVFCVIISGGNNNTDRTQCYYMRRYNILVNGRIDSVANNYEILDGNGDVNRVNASFYNSLFYLSGKQMLLLDNFSNNLSVLSNRVLYDKDGTIIPSTYQSWRIPNAWGYSYKHLWFSDPDIILPEGIYRLNYAWMYSDQSVFFYDLNKNGKKIITVPSECNIDNFEDMAISYGSLYAVRSAMCFNSGEDITLRVYACQDYNKSFIEASYESGVDITINGINYKTIMCAPGQYSIRSHYISLKTGWNDIIINTKDYVQLIFYWSNYGSYSHNTNSMSTDNDVGYGYYNNCIFCEYGYWHTNHTYRVICGIQYPDVTYNWTATSNCTIVSGQGTAEIVVTPTLAGTAVTIDCAVTYKGNIINLHPFTVASSYVFNG